jgi:hypothetical protein
MMNICEFFNNWGGVERGGKVPSRIPKASGLTIAGEMKRRKKKFCATQEAHKVDEKSTMVMMMMMMKKKTKVADTYGENDVFTLRKLLHDLSLQVVAHGSERPAPRGESPCGALARRRRGKKSCTWGSA